MTSAPRGSQSIAAELKMLLGGLFVAPAAILLWALPWSIGERQIDPRWLPAIVWLVFLAVRALASRGSASNRVRRASDRVMRVWGIADPWLAAAAIHAVLFRAPESAFLPTVWVGALGSVLWLLRRAPGPVLLAFAVAAVGVGIVLPRAFQSMLISRIAATHELTVDHRMKPDGGEINSDGLRFRGEAEDLAVEDFVVLFLGDSYTFGFDLYYREAYPYRFEKIAETAMCDLRIRSVNFGWTSSSPLLSLRLLREKGYAYQPDLVVYNLDMTDFHDDLRYEMHLRGREDFEFDQTEFTERLIASYLPSADRILPAVRAMTSRLRSRRQLDRKRLIEDLPVPRPSERYFVTKYPLNATRAGIELGVMRNLEEMSGFVDDVLGAQMALVVYPRAYQYSMREAPQNWEANKYQRLGPYVREPFRYFAEVAPELPYPVVDLLPHFEAASEFPLFFPADPHWNEAGARVAAEGVFSALARRRLIPCSPVQ